MNVELFESCLRAIGLELSNEQLERFLGFEEDLYRANEVVNLTRVPREECAERHFIDSLLFHDLIPTGAKVLDIGSGPGFPAWPLASARPDLDVTALDSNGKMLGFLSMQSLPNLKVVNARAEEWNRREAFDVVTGRAVAPLSAQLEISAAYCHIGGFVLPMRSESDEALLGSLNLKPLGLSLTGVERRALPISGTVRVFPRFEKLKPTAPGYPRRWAEVKRKPL